jgi:hypothetical protein
MSETSNCCSEYRRLAQYCVKREAELAYYKRLAYEYYEQIRRLTMLLSATVAHLRNIIAVTNYQNDNLNNIIYEFSQEVEQYMKKYVLNNEDHKS